MREWEPSEDELLGMLIDLELAKDKAITKKALNEVDAIESQQELLRRLYHG